MNLAAEQTITTDELRAAFKRSGLWRHGWTFAKAIATECTLISLRGTAKSIRNKYQQQHGKPAPEQQALI